MPNVKPGDLCLVVGAKTPGLNGRVVEVIAKVSNGAVFRDENGVVCTFQSHSDKSWEVVSLELLPWRMLDGFIRKMKTRPAGDRFLIKIKDGDLTLDETSEVEKDIDLTKEKEAA